MQKSEHHEYVAELEKRVATLTRLLEVNNVMNSTLLNADSRLESVLSYLMDTAADLTDSEAASVLLWNNNTRELFFAASTTSIPASRSLIGRPVPLDSIAGTILRERQIVQVDDTASDPRHYNELDKENSFVTRSLLGVPMISKNRAIGVLEVVNKRQLPWTMDDRENLSVLATEAAVAIEVAQLVVNLQRANEELSEVDKLKNDFIAIASHELRTPLGIIMGYASFLQDSEDKATSGHASKVMDSALQLRRIIEDMINLRQLKQKPANLVRERLPLGMLIDDLQRDVLTLAGAGQHDLKLECDDPDVTVLVDRSRISMALVNVLNNAFTFTPKDGKIRVRAHVPNEREAWISISDDGTGLEEVELERIFDEFYQVEDHMTRHRGGLGIGLSIARALVKAHGGRIWASSPGLGQGATFTIALPLARDKDS
jgi:signal transduction histidine kinase